MAKRNIFILLISFLFFTSENSFAQKYFSKAEEHYRNFEYELAIPFYKDALSVDTTLAAVEHLADCYRLTHRYKEALKYYSIALDIPYYSSTSVFYYAEMLLKTGNYTEAEAQYLFYLNYEPKNISYINNCIETCRYARVNKTNALKVTIENVKEINTKYSETGIYVGKKSIYFSSDRKYGSNTNVDGWTGNPYYKIYSIPYSIKNNKVSLQRAKAFDMNINSGYHNSFPTFNEKENKMYFTFTELEENPRKKYQIKAKDFTNRINIYDADLIGRRWQKGKTLKMSDSINYSVLHPCLNIEGNKLYFSSDMPGGYGSYDIYYVDIDENGNFSTPKNLGPKINTSGMEVFPSYADDSTLYFSSNGQIGFGGLDIFEVKLNNSEVISIKNIGFPINSSYDDFSYFPLKTLLKGYFCSDREGGNGRDDIYSVEWTQ